MQDREGMATFSSYMEWGKVKNVADWCMEALLMARR
jgi:hypothetical protein